MPAQVQLGWPGRGIPIGPKEGRFAGIESPARSPPFLTIAGHPRHTLWAYLNGLWAGSEETCAGFQSRLANYPGGVKHTHNAHHKYWNMHYIMW